MDVTDMGRPIKVPMGEEVVGRILNVSGDPVENRGEVKTTKKYPIHRPALFDQDTGS
jgi:F-type H+-transporting ATPase subunit beta